MKQLNTRLRSRKGFTLAELLIVVAIIAVLVAIALPVFSSQLEKSREAVDKANMRSAESMAVATYLMFDGSGSITFHIGKSTDSDSLGISKVDSANFGVTTGAPTTTANTNYPINKGYNKYSENDPASTGKAADKAYITVTVEDGRVTDTKWVAAS